MENVEILEGNIKFKNKHKIPQKAQYIKNSTEICSYGCGNIAKYLAPRNPFLPPDLRALRSWRQSVDQPLVSKPRP